MTDTINGQASPSVAPPESPHGVAGLLLAESVLHCLIAKSVLSVEEAIDCVEVAQQVAAEATAEAPRLHRPAILLQKIAISLGHDLPRTTDDVANDS